MAIYNYDVVIIGSGPAGEGAAMNSAKNGRKVAVVDSRPQVGGNCTHLGTCLLYTSPSPRDRG